MQETEKKPMFDLNQDHVSRALVGKFLSGEIRKLEPVYDCQTGYHYPVVEDIVGEASQVEPLLKRLAEAEVLDRTLYDKVIVCPKCGSTNVSFRYCCPFCKSFDIQKSSLVEHIKCGYMDLEVNFRRANRYFCPKCHEEMREIEVDYRKAGVWCSCHNCNKSFDIPLSENFCRRCNTTSTFEEASFKEVYSYTLARDVKVVDLQSLFLAAPLQEFFVKEGLTVKSPASLKGKSGAKHTFDIIAHQGSSDAPENLIVVDLATSIGDPVNEQPVISLFAKIFDVAPEKAYLIAIPRLNENGKRMAELYNIKIVEAENPKEAIKFLKASLEK
jgi:hypothetical protein